MSNVVKHIHWVSNLKLMHFFSSRISFCSFNLLQSFKLVLYILQQSKHANFKVCWVIPKCEVFESLFLFCSFVCLLLFMMSYLLLYLITFDYVLVIIFEKYTYSWFEAKVMTFSEMILDIFLPRHLEVLPVWITVIQI